MEFPVGILDQSPVVSGALPSDAIAATIALARRADELGYHRYWLAEHHAMRGLADASPEVLLARLTAETHAIRLGTGGIMLPHYSAFKVAETFRMLEALAPGRIDLGLGRAPGGTPLVSAALESRDPSLFPAQVAATSGRGVPEVWMLGSSDYGARLAADMGLAYAYAHFIGGDASHVLQAYRARFQPSAARPEPYCAIALAAIVAPSDEEAEELALPLRLWRLRVANGISSELPSAAEARAYPWTPLEREQALRSRRVITGSPETARDRIAELVAAYGADEALIVTITPDYASRLRSYELLAGAFSLATAASLA
jgi:alkanesulfonate monooxygenase SsuD/methylene tetrahydromethanopterin reductase-like flavin-dependent oxidoreductase (luciferase family)